MPSSAFILWLDNTAGGGLSEERGFFAFGRSFILGCDTSDTSTTAESARLRLRETDASTEDPSLKGIDRFSFARAENRGGIST